MSLYIDDPIYCRVRLKWRCEILDRETDRLVAATAYHPSREAARIEALHLKADLLEGARR